MGLTAVDYTKKPKEAASDPENSVWTMMFFAALGIPSLKSHNVAWEGHMRPRAIAKMERKKRWDELLEKHRLVPISVGGNQLFCQTQFRIALIGMVAGGGNPREPAITCRTRQNRSMRWCSEKRRIGHLRQLQRLLREPGPRGGIHDAPERVEVVLVDAARPRIVL